MGDRDRERSRRRVNVVYLVAAPGDREAFFWCCYLWGRFTRHRTLEGNTRQACGSTFCHFNFKATPNYD